MKKEYEPLERVRRDFAIDWYRCPIPKDRLRELTQRSDLKGFAQSLGYLALLVVTGGATWILFDRGLWGAFAAALFCFGTIVSFNPGLVTHELSHGTVFRTKWLNSLFLRFYSLLGWVNFHHYKRSHTFHHLYTLHPRGDREVTLPRVPSLHPVRLFWYATFNFPGFWTILSSTLSLAFVGRFTNEWSEAIFPPEAPEARRQARRWAWVLLGFHAAVITVSAVFRLWPLAILVTLGGFIASWWSHFVGEPMHTGLRDNVPDFRLCCRTITLDPFSRFIYWYMNYHTEHHMYAAVPCYNLPRLAAAIASDMPAPRSVVGAWAEMRKTWLRQKKEPGYQFDTPLPRPKGAQGGKDVMAGSLGDLAPKGLD